jgi:hypothetical protein
MLAALEVSGQQGSVFARARGFAPHRVSDWRARLSVLGEQAAGSKSGGFVAVVVRDEAPAPAPAMQASEPTARWQPRVEVMLGNGRRIAFAGTWEAAEIGPWLRALEGT